MRHNLGRNDPCWCGSGLKYKRCHLTTDRHPTVAPQNIQNEHADQLEFDHPMPASLSSIKVQRCGIGAWPEFLSKQYTEAYTEKGAAEYGLQKSASLDQEMPAIWWINVLSAGIAEAFRATQPKKDYWGIIYSMLDRAREHVMASIICYATGYPSSGEAVARTALESSINIRYILAKDTKARLKAYFEDFVNEDAKEITRWENTMKVDGQDLSEFDKLQIESRRDRHRAFQKLVAVFPLSELDNDSMKTWPNILERYKELDEAPNHRTYFTRMCKQAHNSAEDLISHLAATASDQPNAVPANRQEIAAFSRTMIYHSVQEYLKSLLETAKKFDLDETLRASIESGIAYAHRVELSLVDKIGAPSQLNSPIDQSA